MSMRQQMNEMGYSPDPAPAVMHFLTARLRDKDVADMRKLIPGRHLVEAWRDIEDRAKELAKKLTGKDAATPSRAWRVLSEARPEMILFLGVTARQQAVDQKIKNFFGKWRQVQQKIPLPEMAELHITPQMPEYRKIAHDVFLLLLDGKLRSRTETLKFLKPLAPPPPPPPPPPPAKRGRAAKAAQAAALVSAQPPVTPAKPGRKKKEKTVASLAAAPASQNVVAPSPRAVARPSPKPPARKSHKPGKSKPVKPAKKVKPKLKPHKKKR